MERVKHETNNDDKNRKLFLEILPSKGETGVKKMIEIMTNKNDWELLDYFKKAGGSQFQFDGFSGSYLTAYGPGLAYGTCGEPTTFTVCVRGEGTLGDMGVSIEGPPNIEIKCHDNKDGTYSISWIAPMPGEYKVRIKFNDKEIHQSPFIARITRSQFQFDVDGISGSYLTASGPGLAYGTCGEPTTFTVCVREGTLGDMGVTVEGPANTEIKCHDNKDGTYSVSWIASMPGEYKVRIKFNGKEIHQSPFIACITDMFDKRQSPVN